MDKLWLGVRDVADLLSISRSAVYVLVERGLLRRIPDTGTRVLISRREVERFAAEREPVG